MKVLRRGSDGVEVEGWQEFLRGEGYSIVADGDFGPATELATKQWQGVRKLNPDGVVGSRSIGAALLRGMSAPDLEVADANWPPKPTWLRHMTPSEREDRFGDFDFDPAPSDRNPERITVHGGWAAKHIVKVTIPFSGGKNVRVHRGISESFVSMWEAWAEAGLADRVLRWNGSYVPRFIRGSKTRLSNHSWGTAFDINAAQNGLGKMPALKGERGSVRELVEIANRHGFFWGGHFRRRDGMHFEAGMPLGTPT